MEEIHPGENKTTVVGMFSQKPCKSWDVYIDKTGIWDDKRSFNNVFFRLKPTVGINLQIKYLFNGAGYLFISHHGKNLGCNSLVHKRRNGFACIKKTKNDFIINTKHPSTLFKWSCFQWETLKRYTIRLSFEPSRGKTVQSSEMDDPFLDSKRKGCQCSSDSLTAKDMHQRFLEQWHTSKPELAGVLGLFARGTWLSSLMCQAG